MAEGRSGGYFGRQTESLARAGIYRSGPKGGVRSRILKFQPPNQFPRPDPFSSILGVVAGMSCTAEEMSFRFRPPAGNPDVLFRNRQRRLRPREKRDDDRVS